MRTLESTELQSVAGGQVVDLLFLAGVGIITFLGVNFFESPPNTFPAVTPEPTTVPQNNTVSSPTPAPSPAPAVNHVSTTPGNDNSFFKENFKHDLS